MVWDVTEMPQEIVLLPELPEVPSRTQDPQATYNTKAFNFRAAERELQQKFNRNVPLLNAAVKVSTDIAPNMDAINTVAGAVEPIATVSEHLIEVSAVSVSMADVAAVSDHIADVKNVNAHMDAVLQAPQKAREAASSAQGAAASATQAQKQATAAEQSAQAARSDAGDAAASATQAGKSAQGAAQSAKSAETSAWEAAMSAANAAASAADAGTSAGKAEQSVAKARAWAENAEDTPVETGKFSALHWAAKSRKAALTALGGIPLIDAADTGRTLLADGKTLTWVKGPTFTDTPAAGAVPKADASGKLNAWVDVPTPWSPGDIKMWFGEVDTTGKHPLVNGAADTRWHVCDGTDGTPDMRDRVPMGAGATKAKGTKGGSATHGHTLSVSVGDHAAAACTGSTASTYSGVSASTASAGVSGTVGSTTLSTSQMPSHRHTITNGAGQMNTTTSGSSWALISGSTSTTNTNLTGGSSSHNHSFSGGSHSHSISESTHSHGAGTLKTPALSHSASGSVAAASNLPPYVALHFLMYVGE